MNVNIYNPITQIILLWVAKWLVKDVFKYTFIGWILQLTLWGLVAYWIYRGIEIINDRIQRRYT